MGFVGEVREAIEVAGSLDLANQLQHVREELAVAKQQLRERDERDQLRTSLVYRDNAYWMGEGDSERAYCLPCWDSESKLGPLMVYEHSYKCLNCGKHWPRSTAPAARRTRPFVVRSQWMEDFRRRPDPW